MTDSPSLNDLARQSHATAVEKGFYEKPEMTYLLQTLPLMIDVSDSIDELTAVRKGIPTPEGIQVADLDIVDLMFAQKLLLIVSECAEAFRELVAADREKESYEIADIAIRLFDYAAARGFDLDKVVHEKMAANAERPRKHGARF